jgi:hypothetical protein
MHRPEGAVLILPCSKGRARSYPEGPGLLKRPLSLHVATLSRRK